MRSFRSVDWAMIGNFISGIIVILAFIIAYFEPLWGAVVFGVFVGWWGGGIFWAFWIDNNKEGTKT